MSYKGFAEPKHLITPADLKARLDEVALIDVRAAHDYATGHIEGTAHFDLYGISLNDTAEAPLNAFLSMFKNLFSMRGVTDATTVVFYDGESGERAARGVWLLEVLDHPDARLLDGGVRAWEEAGYDLTAAAAPVAPAACKGGRRLDRLATRFDVHDAIDDPDVILVDTRRESEYRGTEQRARRVGTIPGAVHVFWRDHLDAKGAFRPAGEIRELYESRGVTPDKTIIPYCQGGYRSANTYLALKMLGYPKVRNYLGSWGEWGNRDDSVIVLPED
ncbi:MAG: sulfurtransferase [Proteobacteria bacterium]|nr:sulfurtransferase [Pseudomonadota bacterium]